MHLSAFALCSAVLYYAATWKELASAGVTSGIPFGLGSSSMSQNPARRCIMVQRRQGDMESEPERWPNR